MVLTLEGARKSCGFTQKEMAKILNITERTYIKKENNIGMFRLNELIKMKSSMNLSSDNVIEIFFEE